MTEIFNRNPFEENPCQIFEAQIFWLPIMYILVCRNIFFPKWGLIGFRLRFMNQYVWYCMIFTHQTGKFANHGMADWWFLKFLESLICELVGFVGLKILKMIEVMNSTITPPKPPKTAQKLPKTTQKLSKKRQVGNLAVFEILIIHDLRICQFGGKIILKITVITVYSWILYILVYKSQSESY